MYSDVCMCVCVYVSVNRAFTASRGIDLILRVESKIIIKISQCETIINNRVYKQVRRIDNETRSFFELSTKWDYDARTVFQ